jgi:hypothetical protein
VSRRETDVEVEVEMEVAVESVDDVSSGETKAYYLPIEPRRPAPPTRPPFAEASAPTPRPTPGATPGPRSVAELFQDMLRQAFEAGVVAADSGEAFESWYQREVLQ